MSFYIYASTIAFAVLTLIWSSHHWYNFVMKFTWFVLMVIGTVCSLIELGYIIK